MFNHLLNLITAVCLLNIGAQAAPTPSFADFDQRAKAGEHLSVVFFGASLTWGSNATSAYFDMLMSRWLADEAIASNRMATKAPKSSCQKKANPAKPTANARVPKIGVSKPTNTVRLKATSTPSNSTDWGRCPDRGEANFKHYVGFGILSYNLHRIGAHLQEKDRTRQRRQKTAA